MAVKKNIADLDNAFSQLDSMTEQSKGSRHSKKAEVFKKPNSDYYRLDMIVRGTVRGPKGHMIATEEIKKDYKDYVVTMADAEGMSITGYIQRLLDNDMRRHNKDYEALKKKKR